MIVTKTTAIARALIGMTAFPKKFNQGLPLSLHHASISPTGECVLLVGRMYRPGHADPWGTSSSFFIYDNRQLKFL
jgi:hypothetical protein